MAQLPDSLGFRVALVLALAMIVLTLTTCLECAAGPIDQPIYRAQFRYYFRRRLGALGLERRRRSYLAMRPSALQGLRRMHCNHLVLLSVTLHLRCSMVRLFCVVAPCRWRLINGPIRQRWRVVEGA